MIKLTFNWSDFSVIGSKGSDTNLITTTNPDIATVLTAVLDTMLIIASGLALLSLIIGAYQYILAGGDPQRAEIGKKTILWTVIGMVLLILFYAILTFILQGQPGITDIHGVEGGIVPKQ